MLPESWDTYLSSLDERYRREINRKIRNAADYFLSVDWYIVDNTQDLDQEMDDFLELMANNPRKKEFLTEDMVIQMKKTAQAASKSGWLQLAFLTVGDLKAAGYINFDYEDKIWVYNSGINSLFENLSPGWVLLTKLIESAINKGKTEFDFMRGDEQFKYIFGGKDKNVVQILIKQD
jgi:CelD/BcsL family acetyltransferase involved in cellulose biosynthesis